MQATDEAVGRGMLVAICGIEHKVIEVEDVFDATECHFGQIDFKKCEIRVNKDLTDQAKAETICHEMVHGILVHLGYNEYSDNEQFVQALGNAIFRSFRIRNINEEMQGLISLVKENVGRDDG